MNPPRIPTPTEKLKEALKEALDRIAKVESRLHQLENKGVDE